MKIFQINTLNYFRMKIIICWVRISCGFLPCLFEYWVSEQLDKKCLILLDKPNKVLAVDLYSM